MGMGEDGRVGEKSALYSFNFLPFLVLNFEHQLSSVKV